VNGNSASNAPVRTDVRCLLGIPQAPVQNPVGIFHLKALVSLGLHRLLSLAEKKKTSAKYF